MELFLGPREAIDFLQRVISHPPSPPEPCLERAHFTEPPETFTLPVVLLSISSSRPGAPSIFYRLRSQMDQTNQSWAKKASVIGQRRFSTLMSLFAQDDPRTPKYFTLRICRQTWVDITPSTIYPP